MIPFISHSFPIHFIFYHLFSFLFPKSLKGSFSSDPFFGAANILLHLARPRRPRTTGPRRPRRPCNGGFGGLAPHGKEIMQITRDACCGQITYVPGALLFYETSTNSVARGRFDSAQGLSPRAGVSEVGLLPEVAGGESTSDRGGIGSSSGFESASS